MAGMEAVRDQEPLSDVAADPSDGQSGRPVGHPGDVAGGVAGELLAGLDGLPVADHVPIFERAHATLVAMLDDETGQPGDRAGDPARSLASPPRG